MSQVGAGGLDWSGVPTSMLLPVGGGEGTCGCENSPTVTAVRTEAPRRKAATSAAASSSCGSITFEHAGGESTFPIPCPPIECIPCPEGVVVTEAVNSGMYTGRESVSVGDVPECGTAVLDGVDRPNPGESFVAAEAWEVEARRSGFHQRAPLRLRTGWSSTFPFDTPGFEWIYLQTGGSNQNRTADGYPDYWDSGMCDAPAYSTDPAMASFGAVSSFAVMGLRPYAVYEIVRADPVTGLEDGVVTLCAHNIQVRVWCGISHHFSFFLSPDSYYSPRGVYGTADLPPAVWYEAPVPSLSKVPSRGTLVQWFLRLVHSVTFTIRWQPPGATAKASEVRYTCNPLASTRGSSANSYADAAGDPTSLCFSNPGTMDSAVANLADGELMSAFLGHVVSGEVCLFQDGGVVDEQAAARDAFAALFGERVELQCTPEWFGVGGDGQALPLEPAATGTRLGPPHVATVDVCLRAADVVPVFTEIANINALRQTPEGRWVFRNTDVNSLEAAAVELTNIRARVGAGCACPE